MSRYTATTTANLYVVRACRWDEREMWKQRFAPVTRQSLDECGQRRHTHIMYARSPGSSLPWNIPTIQLFGSSCTESGLQTSSPHWHRARISPANAGVSRVSPMSSLRYPAKCHQRRRPLQLTAWTQDEKHELGSHFRVSFRSATLLKVQHIRSSGFRSRYTFSVQAMYHVYHYPYPRLTEILVSLRLNRNMSWSHDRRHDIIWGRSILLEPGTRTTVVSKNSNHSYASARDRMRNILPAS